MKVLITGTAGFILGNFVRKTNYERKDLSIIGVDKLVKSLDNVYVNSNTLRIGDVADEHFINTIFEIEKPDAVIHGAAESFVDHSLKNPNIFIHSNVLGTQVIVNACIKYNVKKLVLLSSDEIYGQLSSEDDALWTEDSPMKPRNPYSASKAASELIVQAAGHSFGLNYCITRSSNNYGPWQTAEKFIPKVIQCIMNDKKIPIYGQGKQIRDWMHVWDNCSAILKVLDNGKSGEIYNISANQEFSNIEIVNMICGIMGKGHSLIDFVAERPGHDFRYGINSSKMRQLGWSPNFKLKHGLTKTVEWYKLNNFMLKTNDKNNNN